MGGGVEKYIHIFSTFFVSTCQIRCSVQTLRYLYSEEYGSFVSINIIILRITHVDTRRLGGLSGMGASDIRVLK